MYRIALCDDNREFLEILNRKVKKYYRNKGVVIQCFDDSYLLMSLIEKDNIFDAYILDIEMQEYSGIQIAKMIKERSSSAAIVFLTAFNSYAVEACGMHIFRYVIKRDMEITLQDVLDDLFTYLEKQNGEKFYQIVNQRKCIRFFQREIVYITKDQKNAVFHKVNGREEYERITLQEAYRKLDNEKEMYFVDRSLIINLFYIRRVEKDFIEMHNGIKYYFNSHRINEIKKRISIYWGSVI